MKKFPYALLSPCTKSHADLLSIKTFTQPVLIPLYLSFNNKLATANMFEIFGSYIAVLLYLPSLYYL